MGSDSDIAKQETEPGACAAIEEMKPEAGKIELRRVACHMTESLFKRILRRVFPDQRKNERHVQPPLVGYLGTMNSSRRYEVGDISLSGFCLLTDERWTAGTEMPITLERTALPEGVDAESFTVQATVVRCGNEGVGFSIVLCEEDSKAVLGNPLRVRWMSRQEMELFLQKLKAPEVDGAEPGVAPKAGALQPAAGMKTAFEGGH